MPSPRRDASATAPPRPAARDRDGAERLAIRALGFLAVDDERRERFLALAGLGPDTLREAAAAPGFLAHVLEHLTGDEPALLAFCAEAGLAPEAVASARETLADEPPA
ncbi:MAG: DUF3572 domain-containing protein [Rhodoblastus sp.]|nr:MAG: DUF3572 domain-containing protein [Rhodoblastus sp.]